MRNYPPLSPPPSPTEEDAFNCIVRFTTSSGGMYGYDLYLPNAMHQYISDVHKLSEYQDARQYFGRISRVFYAAAWDLCRRGILRPGVREYGEQSTDDGSAGNGYSLTPFGRQWLKEAGGSYDYVPSEPGRFAQLLDMYSPRFGEGFKERAQEAIRCYGAHAYLACCAMCGAAAESITLAVAIAKDRDAAKIERMYLASGGRGRLEKYLISQQAQAIQDEFRGYMSLLKYWRDLSAHGMASGIQDNEAYTSLAVLLRFAQFARDRWNELTT